jgi:hypothetical protein
MITAQWQEYASYRSKIDHIVEWVEFNPQRRFEELLKFLLKEQAKLPKRKGKQIWSYSYDFCKLDMVGLEEPYHQSNEKDWYSKEDMEESRKYDLTEGKEESPGFKQLGEPSEDEFADGDEDSRLTEAVPVGGAART